MSAFSGPEISSSGLVFYYDINNTEKSWRGKPTTNNAANGRVDYYSRWATTTSHPPLPFSKKTDVYILTLGNNYLGGSGDFNITNGNTYTISYWYHIDTVQTMYHYMLPLNGSYATVATASASTFVNTNNTRNVSGNIDGWVWGYQTFTVNAVPTYMRGTYTDAGGFSDNDPTGKMYITNVMIESGATPSGPYGYTGSSRTSTQALVDLTNNNTITATSLTYSNNGTFSFDGSNNYVQTTTNCNITGSLTLSAWIKPSRVGQTGPHSTIICTDINYPYGAKLMNYKNSTRYGIWLGWAGAGNTNYEAFVGTDINDNTIKMLTASWNQSTGIAKVYLNGVLQSTQNTGNTSALALFDGIITLGTDYNNIGSANLNKYLGSIYNASVYNRTLSDSEVFQNFIAQRGRFGI